VFWFTGGARGRDPVRGGGGGVAAAWGVSKKTQAALKAVGPANRPQGVVLMARVLRPGGGPPKGFWGGGLARVNRGGWTQREGGGLGG